MDEFILSIETQTLAAFMDKFSEWVDKDTALSMIEFVMEHLTVNLAVLDCSELTYAQPFGTPIYWQQLNDPLLDRAVANLLDGSELSSQQCQTLVNYFDYMIAAPAWSEVFKTDDYRSRQRRRTAELSDIIKQVSDAAALRSWIQQALAYGIDVL